MIGEGSSKPGSQQCIQPPEDTPGQYATGCLGGEILVLGQEDRSLFPSFRRQDKEFDRDSGGEEARDGRVPVGQPQGSGDDAVKEQRKE